MATGKFDIVLYGATGFVGSRTAEYLARHPERERFRFALAGRNRGKIEALQQRLAASARGVSEIGVLVADSADRKAVAAMASQGRVLINTAGPFSLYGDLIVDACVQAKTHYVDITGEPVWVRALIDRHHERAAADGTRIIPCCGFDSVPSDIGTLFVARHAQRTLGAPCVEVANYYQMYGGFNGGTIASNMHRYESGDIERGRDPFLLVPDNGHHADDIEADRDTRGVHFDVQAGAWVGPFIMAPINTRVVRRSAALFAQWDEPYGPLFRYQEYTKFDAPFGHLKANVLNGLMTGFDRAMTHAATRDLLKKVLPKPGAGPSEKTMANGWFTADLIGRTADGRRVRATIRHQGDPSNRATLKFVSEAALCLALDGAALPGGADRGGLLTPATGLGEALLKRLRAAATTIEIVP